jgi:hypothetical protein
MISIAPSIPREMSSSCIKAALSPYKLKELPLCLIVYFPWKIDIPPPFLFSIYLREITPGGPSFYRWFRAYGGKVDRKHVLVCPEKNDQSKSGQTNRSSIDLRMR